MEGFRLTVITQEGTIVDREVLSVTAPGTEGYLGIWHNHAPLATALDAGTLTVKETDGRTGLYAVSGGFLEVSRNVVTLLADSIERSDEIDPSRAQQSVDRALKRLELTTADFDIDRVQRALKRNRLRLKLAERSSTH